MRVLLHPSTPDESELRRRLANDQMNQPFIFEIGQERRLHFSWHATQSTLLRLESETLVSRYARKMMAFLLLNPTPRRILMLGLGGGELARFCYSRLPRAEITIVEIDPQVIALRDEFHVPPDGERFRVVCADGAAYVRKLAEPVDALLIDAFDRDGIAPSLGDSEFYRDAARCLSEAGVMAMNFSGARERFAINLIAARRVFGRNLRMVSVLGGNTVLFASRRALPANSNHGLERRAVQLQDILRLDFPHLLRRLCRGVASV